MSIFIDSSIFLRLLLDEPGAEEAENILELGKLINYIVSLMRLKLLREV